MLTNRSSSLCGRDKAILNDLACVRLLTGRQIERLHFMNVRAGNSRATARRRTLGRLVSHGLVLTLPRRVGGVRAGSAGNVYTLDGPGRRLLGLTGQRRPWPIGWAFARHTLDVAELYVRLRERAATTGERLLSYQTEPGCWVHVGGEQLKPDAYAIYEAGDWERHDWIEVDRGTESLPTLQRKLAKYLAAAESGDRAGLVVVPQVLITVPDERREEAVEALIAALPEPASDLIRVERFDIAYRAPPAGAVSTNVNRSTRDGGTTRSCSC